jgi:hypothetical protein
MSCWLIWSTSGHLVASLSEGELRKEGDPWVRPEHTELSAPRHSASVYTLSPSLLRQLPTFPVTLSVV